MKRLLLSLIYVLMLSGNILAQTPQADMNRALALVPVTDATATATMTGLWSNVNVWGGVLPKNGDKVVIPAGIVVSQDVDSPRLKWLRIDGSFGPLQGATITLTAETIVSTMDSSIRAGTGAEAPFTGQWNVVLADLGALDTTTDPYAFGRTFMPMGSTTLYGQAVEPYCLTIGNSIGDTTVALQSACTGWKVGDQVVLPGTGFALSGGKPLVDDDVRTVTAIAPDSLSITVSSPLIYPHSATDRESLSRRMFVANISPRSIDFRSENTTDFTRRGHVMVMREDLMTDFDFQYCSFTELGRTNKSLPVTDPNGQGGGLANPRARYAFHPHRLGPSLTGEMANVYGCLVRGSPGWGFVNHDSYAKFCRCVSYNVFGAHFVGEIGTETGTFCGCVAVRSDQIGTTAPESVASTAGTNADWFKSGIGFATMAGGIQITNCVATGMPSWGHIKMGNPFGLSGTPDPQFDVANLPPGSYPGHTTCPPGFVPQNDDHAHCFGCRFGFFPWNLNLNGAAAPPIGRSSLTDCKLETDDEAMELGYLSNFDTLRVTAVRIGKDYRHTAFEHSGVNTDSTTIDCAAYGYEVGKRAGTLNGQDIIRFTGRNLCDILVMNARQAPRSLPITQLTSLPIPPADLAPIVANTNPYLYLYFKGPQNKQQKGVALIPNNGGAHFYTPRDFPFPNFLGGDFGLVDNDIINLDGKRLFFPEQQPGFIFDPAQITSLQPQLAGLTNDQAWSQFGMTVSGRRMPADCTVLPGHVAYYSPSGTPHTYYPMTVTKYLGLSARNWQETNNPIGYVCKVKDTSGTFQYSAPTNLALGPNVVMVLVDGVQRGVFVMYDPTKVPVASW